MRIRPAVIDSTAYAVHDDPTNSERDDERIDDKDDRDDKDEAPETPLDEPRPPRVQDPPPQPDTQGPYVV